MDSKTPYILGGLAVVGVGAYFLLRKKSDASTPKTATPVTPKTTTPTTTPTTPTVGTAAPPGWPASLPWPPQGLPTGAALPTAKPAWWPAGVNYPPTATDVSNLPVPGGAQAPADVKFNRLGSTAQDEQNQKISLWGVFQKLALTDESQNPAILDPMHTVGPGSDDPTGTSAAMTIARLNSPAGGGQYVLVSTDPTNTSLLFTNLEGAKQYAGVGQPWTLFLQPNEWATVEAASVASGAPAAVPTVPTSAPAGWPAGVPWPPTGWSPGQPLPTTAPSGWPTGVPWPPTGALPQLPQI